MAGITQVDIDSITGLEVLEYVRAIAPRHFQDLLEYSVALYMRGVLTQSEAFVLTGSTNEEELLEDIAEARRSTARWINS